MARVVLYSSPTCAFCHLVKAFLKKNGVEFEEVDISDEREAKGLEEKTGLRSVPVTFVGEKFVAGFDRKKLEQLLWPEGK